MEGEDRNTCWPPAAPPCWPSPSVWRARIETRTLKNGAASADVALRMEGEDRNALEDPLEREVLVALRMEGEDRNNIRLTQSEREASRPPYGGRG